MKTMTRRGGNATSCRRGFTLIEVMIALAIAAILFAVALPSYKAQIQRSSRQAAQSQLVEMAATQEKIFLNSNAYSDEVAAAYTGISTGGLGVTSGKTPDARYTLTVSVDGASFTLTATPVAGSTQANDGTLTITSNGKRTWGTKSW